MVVSISVVMTWVRDRTRGSVLIAALFHAAMNTTWAGPNVLWGDDRLFWLCVAFTVALAAVVATRQLRDTTATPVATPRAVTPPPAPWLWCSGRVGGDGGDVAIG